MNLLRRAEIKGFEILYCILSKVYRVVGKNLSEEKWKKIEQIIRYLMVGVWNMALSYLVYAGLLLLGAGYSFSNLGSFCFSVLNSFICSQKFVFHGTGKWYKMLGKVALSYMGTGLILQEILLFLWIDLLSVSPFIAPFLNICIITPINFIIQKVWAYK